MQNLWRSRGEEPDGLFNGHPPAIGHGSYVLRPSSAALTDHPIGHDPEPSSRYQVLPPGL